jgi:hypothetical protein
MSERDIAEAVGKSRAFVRQILAQPSPTLEAPPHAEPESLASRLSQFGADLSAAGMSNESALVLEAAARLGAFEVASEPDDEDDGPVPTDSLSVLKLAIENAQRDHRAWQAVGNSNAANRALRTVAMLAPQLARLERSARDDTDTLHIPRADIESAHASLEAKLRLMLDRPLLCAQCGHALSVEWSEGDNHGKQHTQT